MTINLNKIDLVNNFKEFVLGLSSFKESDLRSYFLESENKFKLDIVKSIMDTKKFSLIANEIFIENIYPYLKNNQYIKEIPQELSISSILREFPESRRILKSICLNLTPEGDYESSLGEIIAETEELDRFKITLFIGSLLETVIAINNNDTDIIHKNFNHLSKKERQDFIKYLIGVLVHELTHLIDYFRYTREELLKDFLKFYSIQDGERRAIVQEFLYGFVAEGGVQIIKSTNDVEIFKEYLRKKMNCYQFLDRLDIEPNREFLDEFLNSVYKYFKSGKDEFGKLKTESTVTISPFYHSVKFNDVKNFIPDSSAQELIKKLS